MPTPVSWTEGADDLEALSDAELVDCVRLGDTSMYCELWNRHRDAGLRAAAKITERYDPEDLVQEAFARTLSAISRGMGPREAFRPYLYAAIRNVSMNWTRDETEHHGLDDLAGVVDPESVFDDSVLDRTITGRAFASLRPEWRIILWYTAVEGLPPREAGQYIGLSANAAAALAYRAREGLRTAWIQAHVSTVAFEQGCQWSVERMGTYKRGQLCPADTDRLEDHLTGCLHCSILVEELDNVADRLRSVLVPLIVGPGLANAVEGLGWGSSSAVEAAPATLDTAGVGVPAGLSTSAHAGPVMTAIAVVLTGALGLSGGWVVWHDLRAGAQEIADGVSAASELPPTSAGEDVTPLGLPEIADQEPAAPVPDPDTDPAQLGRTQPSGASDPQEHDATETNPGTDGLDAALGGSEGSTPATQPTSPTLPPREDQPPSGGGTGGGGSDPAPDPQPVPLAAPRVTGLVQSLYLPELSGTAEPGADVIAVADGAAVARTVADAQGAWSATLAFDEVTAAPIDVVVYQELDGRRSDAAPVPGRIDLQAPTVVGVAVTPSPIVTFTGIPGTVIHVAVDGLVTSYQHAVGEQPVVRALIGLSPGPHVVAVRYADPPTGRYGAWTRTAFAIP